jgi:hypothetical protein
VFQVIPSAPAGSNDGELDLVVGCFHLLNGGGALQVLGGGYSRGCSGGFHDISSRHIRHQNDPLFLSLSARLPDAQWP